eukprot:scaffold39675_cov275-Amphora_coffeaeformis.AAC.1
MSQSMEFSGNSSPWNHSYSETVVLRRDGSDDAYYNDHKMYQPTYAHRRTAAEESSSLWWADATAGGTTDKKDVMTESMSSPSFSSSSRQDDDVGICNIPQVSLDVCAIME